MAIHIWACNKDSVFIDYENLPLNLFQEYFGNIEEEDSYFSSDFKQNKNIRLLKFVNHSENVVFNNKQQTILKQEICFLKLQEATKPYILDKIDKALSYALNNSLYLKFEID